MSAISPISAVTLPGNPVAAVAQVSSTQAANPTSAAAFASMVEGSSQAASAPAATNNLMQSAQDTLSIGGASSPMALLAVQSQLIQQEIGWTVASQIAGKVTSGIQTIFTNQV